MTHQPHCDDPAGVCTCVDPDFSIDDIRFYTKLTTETRPLADSILDVYQRAAYEALFATVKFPVIPATRPTRPSRWQRLKYRWRRRWERFTSYRVVSMEDYSSRYDY